MYEDKRRHKVEDRVNPILRKDNLERRIYKRFRTEDDCWAELDISGRVKILDISLGGARVVASHPLSTDIIYKIKICPAEGQEICLAGIVVWASTLESGPGKEGLFLYSGGIKFIEISDSHKMSLDKLSGSFNPL
jgi:tellurite resistance-related uncharacterized protein